MVKFFVIDSFQTHEDLRQVFLLNPLISVSLAEGKTKGGKFLDHSGIPFNLSEYDLIFIHDSDAMYSDTKTYIDQAQDLSKPFVWYSGGFTKNDLSGIEKLQLKLCLSDLSVNLQKFLNRIARDTRLSRVAFKELIIPSLNLMPALSILCQGHISIWLSDIPSDLKDSIKEQMGWTDEFIKSEAGKLFTEENLSDSAKTYTKDAMWWLEPFNAQPEDDPYQFEETLHYEWNISGGSNIQWNNDLKPLVDEIVGNQAISSRSVAKAYFAISDRLTQY